MARTFKVANTEVKNKITRYYVTDADDNFELNSRPIAAEFPISIMFDQSTQLERAEKFAEYLNKLNEAAKVAYDQIHMVDIMSRP